MKLRITVEDKVFEVEVEVLGGAAPGQAVARSAPATAPVAAAPIADIPAPAPPRVDGKVFPSPLSGVIRAVKIKAGDAVQANQEIIILEAMKMETSIYAPAAATVRAVLVKEGDSVQAGTAMVEFD